MNQHKLKHSPKGVPSGQAVLFQPMKDTDCIEFLQWCLPRLRMRWAGFRRVRKQVCKRVSRRISELGLSDFFAYKAYLNNHSKEWERLDSFCQITNSRFYRNQGVFDIIRSQVLPSIARKGIEKGQKTIRCWSAGCGSGEEAYTMQILWQTEVSPVIQADLPLRILATDTNPKMLERAREGRYFASSLKDLPEELVEQAFERSGGFYSIRKRFTQNIELVQQDIRRQLPAETFDIIFCRNLVFTYFEEDLQCEILERILEKLVEGGILVLASHELLPRGSVDLIPYEGSKCIYRKP